MATFERRPSRKGRSVFFFWRLRGGAYGMPVAMSQARQQGTAQARARDHHRLSDVSISYIMFIEMCNLHT
jgi:hypothetical protein